MREKMNYLVSETRNLEGDSKCKIKISREHAKCLPGRTYGVVDSHSCYMWGEPGQPHAGGATNSFVLQLQLPRKSLVGL
ncbi:hypothetical protein TNIN_27141 [Trichonephila inaurata madagascariensis]|uniref:Uncharacterized protein n=1 Tax=Trichonephila inaurata madagascariensis TaxID=2747483 RepID=A0A8X6JKR1_9ARAC|nr:hypothetical protein TNIN_27141 [Trichonephila inaurata madagascariensis]